MTVIQGEMLEGNTDFANLCHFLKPEERLQLFDMLCSAVQKRIPERVSMELGIKRPNVYPYLKRRKKRLVPNAETTAKIIGVFRDKAHTQAVLPILEPAIDRMQISAKTYQRWMKGMKKLNNPFSEAEIERLEWSLSPRRMHF
jgi:hypothetical protein